MYLVIVKRIGTIYPIGSNNRFSLRFSVDTRVQHETPEEGRKTNQPKCCDYNNKNEINSPNILSDNNTNKLQLYGFKYIQQLHGFNLFYIWNDPHCHFYNVPCSRGNFGRHFIIFSLSYNSEYRVWNPNTILRILLHNAVP